MGIEKYFAANAALNRFLATGRFAGRPLYLTLNDEGRQAVANDLGVHEAEANSVVASATQSVLAPKGDPYRWLTARAEHWRAGKFAGAPPITAALYTLAHAAERMHADGEYSSSNYYSRLEELVGIPRDRLSLNGRSTQPLWQVFNRWLASTDFEYGRPTARPINAWAYVGLAMSQAVVTLADRQLFHSLFEKYGFSGNDELSKTEMEQYLNDWIESPYSNPRLRTAWANPALRERVSEAAIAELEDWSSSQRLAAQEGSHSRLSLLGRIVAQFPKSRLVLALGRSGELPDPIGPLYADGLSGPVTLGHTESGTFATLTPNAATSGVLKNGITLGLRGETRTHSWKAKLVIPMVKSANGNFWVEVTRTTLLAETMVLVRNTRRVVDEVSQYLSQAAIPGWSASTASELAGVPEGWLLFTGIRILKPGVETHIDMQALVPLATSAGLVEDGGLRLDRDVWHSHDPPSFQFMGASSPTSLEVLGGYDGDGEQVAKHESNGKDCALRLGREPGLEEGSFVIVATASGQEAARNAFSLRSARDPRPLHRQQSGLVSYMSVHGATQRGEAEAAVSVSGHVVALLPSVSLPSLPSLPPVPSGITVNNPVPSEGDEEAGTSSQEVRFTPPADPSCVENGFHHWVYDSVDIDSSRDAPVARECKFCLQSTLEYRRKRKVKQVAGRAPAYHPAQPAASPQPVTFSAPSMQARATIDHDLLVDALCYLGSGKWGRFEALALRTLEHTWQAVSLAKDLCSLGLLDLSFAPGTGRPIAWSIPPPTLSFTGARRALFTGFRCGPLFLECKAALVSAGAGVVATQLDNGPSVLSVAGISPEAAAGAVGDIRDPHRRKVRVLPDAPAMIAQGALAVSGIAAACHPMELGSAEGLEHFDLASGQWRETPHVASPGAYRSSHAGRTYAVKLGDGRTFAAPFEIAKTIAAGQAASRLHAYDPARREFTSLLGAEPPGLLARALVACSGQLPRREAGRAHFTNVPPPIAATVLHLLYDESQMP